MKSKAQRFLERFYDVVRSPYPHSDRAEYEMFVNPTSKELRTIDNDSVRFFCDPKDEKVYVFPSDLIHFDAIVASDRLKGELGLRPGNWHEKVFSGVAKREGTVFVATESDTFQLGYKSHPDEMKKMIDLLSSSDWVWADKYIKGISKLCKKILNNLNANYVGIYPKDEYMTTIHSLYISKAQRFLEAFFDSVSSNTIHRGGYEMFVNPTLKELRSIDEQYIRFFCDPQNKTVYAFSSDLTHAEAIRVSVKLGNLGWGSTEVSRSSRVFSGVAKREGNEFVAFESDTFQTISLRDNPEKMVEFLSSSDWTWADKYISGVSKLCKDILFDYYKNH